MSKGKLQKFAEFSSFPNTYEYKDDLKLGWEKTAFEKEQPLVLELACGKGEYTTGLAKMHPEYNYLGVDLKGNRMWKGAKKALDNGLFNVVFLRAQIEHLAEFLGENSVAQIWITFADPQPQKSRLKKRLTYKRFLELYKKIMVPGGVLNLKTDSDLLYEYTLESAAENNWQVMQSNNDIYNWPERPEELNIRTFYENIWLEEGKTIKYAQIKPKN